MTLLTEISNRYVLLYKQHSELEKQAEAQLERLEKRLERVKAQRSKVYKEFPSWLDELVKPIAELLAPHFPNYHYHILGPFGICSETAIHFYENGIDEKTLWEGGHIKSITFVPLDLSKGKIAIRDYSVDTGKFPKNTIGEKNGMNHPNIDIPDNADAEWLLKYIT